MCRAPAWPSSPGWNMKITVPGSSACRADSSRAAPASMAVCRSWPQACITPSMAEAYGSPVSSVTGSASMSPRSSTTGPGRPPRSTAVTEDSACPVLISSGSPASASSTLACVLGRSRPISGSAWIACRSSAMSPASFAASSRTDTGTSSAHRRRSGSPYRAPPSRIDAACARPWTHRPGGAQSCTVRSSAARRAPRRPRQLSQLSLAARFAFGLYRERARIAGAGYLARDPMSLLKLRPGRENPYVGLRPHPRGRAAGPDPPGRLGVHQLPRV